MEFLLSDRSRAQVEAVRQFVQNELQPLEQKVEATGCLEPEKATEIFERSRDLVFYAMNIRKEHGDGGLSAVEMAHVEQEMGQMTDITYPTRIRKRLRSPPGV